MYHSAMPPGEPDYATFDDEAPSPLRPMPEPGGLTPADLVDDARAALSNLTPERAVQRAVQLCDSPWVKETFASLGPHCAAVLGLYVIVGPDGETPWPAVIVRVRRTPWKDGQSARTGYVALYGGVSDDGSTIDRLEACEQPRLQHHRYRGALGDPPVFRGELARATRTARRSAPRHQPAPDRPARARRH